MDAYNNAVDKIGDAIIDWSDPDGTFRADREVSKAFEEKVVMIFGAQHFEDNPAFKYCTVIFIITNTQSINQYFRDGGCVTSAVL